MKIALIILTIFLISGCLKIKEIELSENNNIQSSPADEFQSIIPANVDVIVTNTPQWSIELKDASGNPVAGVTPQVSYILTSYPRMFTPTANVSCNPSNQAGISNCESTSSFVPGSLDLTVTVEDWSKTITLNVSCPSDWETEVAIAQRITSPSSLIDRAEEFDLLRCNRSGETYYVDEINFANSLGFIFYPIALNNDVTIEFSGALHKLAINDDPSIYSESPTIFSSYDGSPLQSVQLKGLELSDFSYSSGVARDYYPIIAPSLIQSNIENLLVSNSSIDLDGGAVGFSVSLFNALEEETTVSGVTIEQSKIITKNVDQASFLATEMGDVQVQNINFQDLLLIGNFKSSTGLIASNMKENNFNVSVFNNISITSAFILNFGLESTPYIGGLIGEIVAGVSSRFNLFQDLDINGLYVISSKSRAGGLFGVSNGSVRIIEASVNDIRMAAQAYGGIFGELNINNQYVAIDDSKIKSDFSDLVSPWISAQNLWNFSVSNYGIPLEQIDLEYMAKISSGLAHGINLVDSQLELDRVQITLDTNANVENSSGLAHSYEEDGNVNFYINNFELLAKQRGAVSNALFEEFRGKAGGSFSVNNAILRYAEIGADFKGAFQDFIYHTGTTSFSNIYVHYPGNQYDCEGDISLASPFLKCLNPGYYDTFDYVNYVLNDDVFHTPSYNNHILLDLNIWTPAADAPTIYWQLK